MPFPPTPATPAAAKVHAVVEVLLSSEIDDELRAAAEDLYGLMCGFAGIHHDAPTSADNANTDLPGGQAISPRGASLCVIDYLRTTMFLRGVTQALKEAGERFPGETIEVLYAGCGVFATLLTSLAGRFDTDKVKITLLDVHPRSLEGAKQVFRELGLEAALHECLIVDAGAYMPPSPPHVIIVEVMQRALDKEPQVAVTANLGAYLRTGGIFIPERITVDAWVEYHRENADLPREERLARLIDLTAESAPAWRTKPGSPLPQVPHVKIDLPPDMAQAFRIVLTTEVTVFGPFKLGDNQSGITLPAFRRFKPNSDKRKIEFRYRQGGKPGFDYHWIKH